MWEPRSWQDRDLLLGYRADRDHTHARACHSPPEEWLQARSAPARRSSQNIKPAAFSPPSLHPYPHALPGTSLPHFAKSRVSGRRDRRGLSGVGGGGHQIAEVGRAPACRKLVPDLGVGGTRVIPTPTRCNLPPAQWVLVTCLSCALPQPSS